ncbi:MAG: hypothetical protein ACNA78_07015 [Balneolaceae bacterium]
MKQIHVCLSGGAAAISGQLLKNHPLTEYLLAVEHEGAALVLHRKASQQVKDVFERLESDTPGSIL